MEGETIYEIIKREKEKRIAWLRDEFGLIENPFVVRELFSLNIDNETYEKHKVLFQNRKEILSDIIVEITTSQSSNIILYGERGIGKSSLLNYIFKMLQDDGYLILKINIKSEDVDDNKFRKVVLHNLSNMVVTSLERFIEKDTDKSRIERLKNILFKRYEIKKQQEIKNKLMRLSMLALLYSGDKTVLQGSKGEKNSINLLIGAKDLGLALTKEEWDEVKNTISYDRIPDDIFRGILNAAWDMSQQLDYKGIMIGFDDADKLDDKKMELKLIGLIKDIFYAEAHYHITVVFAKDIVEIVHKNVFGFEQLRAFNKEDFFRLLNTLFQQKSTLNEEIYQYFPKEVLDVIYQDSMGLPRNAILLCKDALLEACKLNQKTITKKIILDRILPPEKKMIIKNMDSKSNKYLILKYLKEKKSDYSSNIQFLKAVNLSQPRLNQLLNDLEKQKFVVSSKTGRRKLYKLNAGITDLLD